MEDKTVSMFYLQNRELSDVHCFYYTGNGALVEMYTIMTEDGPLFSLKAVAACLEIANTDCAVKSSFFDAFVLSFYSREKARCKVGGEEMEFLTTHGLFSAIFKAENELCDVSDFVRWVNHYLIPSTYHIAYTKEHMAKLTSAIKAIDEIIEGVRCIPTGRFNQGGIAYSRLMEGKEQIR